MKRILADLPDEDIDWLDAKAAADGRSRASIVREAVASYRALSPAAGNKDWLDAGFGLWARHGVAYDPHEYDRLRRAEWTRYWDEDYEEVRAESPDCFDEEDDRQRRLYLDMLAGKVPQAKPPA